MTRGRLMSLRARILLGAILWTNGLFAIFGVLTVNVMFTHHPEAPRVMHTIFSYAGTILSIAVISLIAGLFHLRKGLAAVHQLRARLGAVHDGHERRVEGEYPSEVQPLVNDLNALLAHREEAVKRAVAKAGDLAHGLKTPLAILSQEAERVKDGGHEDLAAAIDQQVERMRRQIEYHLAHARAAASGAAPGARCSIAESAQGLARTLRRLYAGRGVCIDVQIDPDRVVRCQREDLDEMLGNLLDNACKWGKSRVAFSTAIDGAHAVMIVDDDGPGLDPSMREAVLQRGVRADEAAPGSGLGLAIVRELSELYGGSISLTDAPTGGLRARLRLPLAG
jgi:signal transduction histidine kinase